VPRKRCMRPRNPEDATTRAGRRSPCRKQGEVAAVAAAAVAPTYACPADTVAYVLRGAPDGELRGRLMRRRNASETGRQNRSSITCPRPSLSTVACPPITAANTRNPEPVCTALARIHFVPYWPCGAGSDPPVLMPCYPTPTRDARSQSILSPILNLLLPSPPSKSSNIRRRY